MKEELYVFVENECYQLDLPKPSGITLKWESILFKDISSLVCSHSYTFKIPMTRNNTTAFNMVEDIRHETSTREKTFKAEFYINGVNICPNAKLYISEIGDSVYSCVMTWNVLEAFQKMKSDSLKLNELPSIGEITWKSGDANLVYGEPVTNLSNKASVLYPAYDAGLPYENGVPPKPVVPIMLILDLINDYYGVNIKIGQEQNSLLGLIPLENFNNPNYHGSKVYDDYITQGCIPLTGIGISSQEEFEIDNLSLIRNIYFCTGSYTRQGRTIQWRRVSDGSYFYADHDMISQDNVTVTADNRIYIYYNVATITIFKKNKYLQWVHI